ncbi:uncharacterized protein LOC117342441 [Pecten maximus]|uniref:uncharacterized protein LOC117342441 n=1 Tax=Pecten maximus TaxID=6579 RepID=UPI001458C7AD|nr:uncharacterized protein LOC117342441 [Pecten maximus]
MASVQRVRPSALRYTHDSISCRFSNGCGLEETFRQILYDEVSVSSLPYLEVMPYDNEWFVVRGNRRLYVLKQLESAGKISTVSVKYLSFESYHFYNQYSTENSGRSVRIRGNPSLAGEFGRIKRTWENSSGGFCQLGTTCASCCCKCLIAVLLILVVFVVAVFLFLVYQSNQQYSHRAFH